VSREYYGVRESPLDEHRDIDMHLWHRITILSNSLSTVTFVQGEKSTMIFNYFRQFELFNLKLVFMPKTTILRVHNPEVVGSNPTPATNFKVRKPPIFNRFRGLFHFCQ